MLPEAGHICPVDITLAMVDGKYKGMVLWHLLNSGIIRFGELRKLIPQATAKMLVQQLRELEKDKLITRTVYPVVPPKVEYALTDLGKSIQPVLLAIYDWGMAYLAANGRTANCSMTASRRKVDKQAE